MPKTGTILLIDDDEDDQLLISQAIQSLGVPYPIQIIDNGYEALHYLETTPHQPFLILCAINMPLLNGLELRATINQSEYLRHKSIPFVFLTTTANAETVQQAYQQSVQGFFQKAVNLEGLGHQLKLLIDYWQTACIPTVDLGRVDN